MDCSVPQGSVLGLLEFISYTDEVSDIFSRHAVNYHLFADDKQLSESYKVSDTSAIICHLSACVTDIATWCASRRLQLNAAKTEIAWFGSRANLNKISGSDLWLKVQQRIEYKIISTRSEEHTSELQSR